MDLLEKKLAVLRELRAWSEPGHLNGPALEWVESEYAVKKLKKLYRELEREEGEPARMPFVIAERSPE